MNELKPCPCCGGTAKPSSQNGFDDMGVEYSVNQVVCSNCCLYTDIYDTPELAAEAWNRRDGEEEARKAILEQKETILQFLDHLVDTEEYDIMTIKISRAVVELICDNNNLDIGYIFQKSKHRKEAEHERNKEAE